MVQFSHVRIVIHGFNYLHVIPCSNFQVHRLQPASHIKYRRLDDWRNNSTILNDFDRYIR